MLTRLAYGRLLNWLPGHPSGSKISSRVKFDAMSRAPPTLSPPPLIFPAVLLQEGLIRRDLSTAVPKFACWKLASLPETLREDELDRLLNMPDAETPIGMRDRAMLLCMSELGLRAGEVARLELGGVDLDCGSSACIAAREEGQQRSRFHPSFPRR